MNLFKRLLKDYESVDEHGNTTLHRAARAGDYDECERCLTNGVPIDAKTTDGWTALHFACRDGHTRIVELLLDRGANPASSSHKRYCPLHFAAREGHARIVELVAQRTDGVDHLNAHSQTPLHLACDEGHFDVVRVLVDKGADINATCTYGVAQTDSQSALAAILAEVAGNTETSHRLKDKRADPNQPQFANWTASRIAERRGHTHIVRFLQSRHV